MVKTSLLKDKAKGAAVASLPVITSLALPVTALAAETGVTSPTGQMFDAIGSGMQTAIQDMVTSVGTLAGSMIPILFPIVGLGIGISICFVLVRRVTNNA